MKYFLAIAWGLIAYLLFISFYSYQKVESSQVKRVLEKYEAVSKTQLTANSFRYRNIIEYRADCFQTDGSLSKDHLPCMEIYILTLLRMSEKDRTAVPNKSGFIRCVRDCPIMFNMCRGNTRDDGQCVVFEERCIEYCLDKEWRGPHLIQRDQGWNRTPRVLAPDFH